MAQVRVKRGKVDFLMELSNISMSGALVDMGTLRVPGWVKKGRVVEIGIIHPIDLDTITLQGEIVRIARSDGVTKFGVHFVELDDQATAGLSRLHEAAKPSLPAPPTITKGRKRPPPLPTQ